MTEYPFKDLLPIDEVLEREGYYNDWTHLDPEVFYSLTQISEYIKTKGYGVDVRLLISQLAEHFGLRVTQITDAMNEFNDLKPKAELSVSQSAEALTKSQSALNVANSADTLSKSIQEQFNQVIIDGDSSVEAAQARVDASGHTNPTLKARLDKEHNEVTAQLAQMVTNVKTFGAKGDGITDDTNAFISALNEIDDGSTLYIPNGHYRLTSWSGYSLTKNINIIGQSKSHVILEGNITNDFMIIRSNFSLEKVGLESWRTVFTGASGVNLDYFVLKDNIIKNNRTIVNWSNDPISKIKEFYFEDCIFQDIEDYVLMGNFSYDLLKIARNKVKNITRYFVRVLGEGSPEDEMTMIAEHNDIEGISNGTLSGNEGVARAFQVASLNIYLRFNKFKDININELSSANATVLYHAGIRLFVEGNTIIDSGISRASGFLFDDKGERSELTHYINNEFISTDEYEGDKSVIGIRGENVLIQGNKFIGLLGVPITIGHAITRNVIVRENFFNNLRSQMAIRAISHSHHLNIENNVFDSVSHVGSNPSTPGGLNVILIDSLGDGVYSDVAIKNNLFKNIQSEASTSAVMVSNPGVDSLGENYVIDGNRMTGLDHALIVRHSGSVDMVQVTNNLLVDIRNSVIRNDIGDRLTNLVVANNYGDFPPFEA